MQLLGESGASYNSFYSNPCSVKSVEYLKLLFISLGSPLATLEMDIFKLTKGCLTLFDMGSNDGPQNVFDHCAQTLKKKKLKLGDF